MLTIELVDFNQLTPLALYQIMQLRSQVFVVEQNCVYLDADGKDDRSKHLCGYFENELVAYTRLLPAGLAYDEACSIGRVVTAPTHRGKGSIAHCKTLWPGTASKIGAQLYLKSFYESFGFAQATPVYLEDGIEHIGMLLNQK
jgi:ElaA protein